MVELVNAMEEFASGRKLPAYLAEEAFEEEEKEGGLWPGCPRFRHSVAPFASQPDPLFPSLARPLTLCSAIRFSSTLEGKS